MHRETTHLGRDRAFHVARAKVAARLHERVHDDECRNDFGDLVIADADNQAKDDVARETSREQPPAAGADA
jgi:hypothetical protein